MIIERHVDCGDLYRRKRHQLLALAHSLTDEQCRVIVPATPDWSVHDVIAHLVGIAADLNALRFGSGDADSWTADQVRTRCKRSIGELSDEWEGEAAKFEEGLRLLGYEIGSHYVGDLLQHTQDIRSALGVERISDDEALVVALDFYLDAFHQALLAAAAGSVDVRTPDGAWTLGSGPVVAGVAAGRFELFRCLGGRRSEAQIRALDWTGDVERVLCHLTPYPMPRADIVG